MLQSAKTAVRKVSFAAERRIKVAMPVDTGRARASWGRWSSGDLRADATDATPPCALSGRWADVEQKRTIALNDGRTQAPAGFIGKNKADAHQVDAEDDQIMGAF
jgi:hypothetical protein